MRDSASVFRRALSRWKITLVGGLIVLLVFSAVRTALISKAIEFDVNSDTKLRTSYEAQVNLESLVSSIKDAESGQRGYIGTGNPRFLQSFELGRSQLSPTLDKVQIQLEVMGLAGSDFNTLIGYIEAKNAEMEESIALVRDGKRNQALTLLNSGRGKDLMDEIRSTVNVISSNLERQQLQLAAESVGSDRTTRQVNVIGGLLTLPVIVLLFYLSWKAIEANYRDKEEKARASAALELAVQRRTRDLKTAKDELEAFSYSVSHDLRGPLRAVISYAGMLEEDYGEKLDDEAREYIDRIKASGRRMSELIDTLLALSRLSRAEMSIVEINASEIALQILEELSASEPHPRRTFSVQPHIMLRADRKMLTTLLENLLRNAWKFSSRVHAPHIEVYKLPDQPIVVVKDNGVGFNSDYANKLFLPFQRLHNEREFEGTGIGLAIVQRIVKRHEGEVWADSEVGEGATFFFRLEPEIPTSKNAIPAKTISVR
jgi:signal transduction histidine kinase